jgi:hypothetical protein
MGLFSPKRVPCQASSHANPVLARFALAASLRDFQHCAQQCADPSIVQVQDLR